MENLKDEVTLQWLKENPESDAFFQLINISDNIVKFLEEKIKEEEKKDHSNIVDIIFVAHGSITGSRVSASSLPQPRITDVLLYSPWNCAINGKAAVKLEHREFCCGIPDRECCSCCCCFSNKKRCDIPDAGHQPTKLPDEWNSMKKAGDQKVPNIMLGPLKPKDGAWKYFEILETQHGEAGRNRIVIPFLLPGLKPPCISMPV